MKTALISAAADAISDAPVEEAPQTAHRAVATTSQATVSTPDPSLGAPPPARSAGAGPSARPGRPSGLNAQMLDALCGVIRETGASDSAAAGRVGVHASTVSRWKRDSLDFAILLRAAREEFRDAQLATIHAEVTAGRATSWRAAAWLLERIFPEDYAPRARERARFQELFEERCAREVEGWEGEVGETIRQSDNQTIGGAVCDRGEVLQNVQNGGEPAARMEAEMSGLPVRALQNVQNSVLGGDGALEGSGAARDGAIHVEGHVSHEGSGVAGAGGESRRGPRGPRRWDGGFRG